MMTVKEKVVDLKDTAWMKGDSHDAQFYKKA
jgi:hypothetical protein